MRYDFFCILVARISRAGSVFASKKIRSGE